MKPCVRIVMALAMLPPAVPAVAVDGRELLRYQEEFTAFNAGWPDANAYRAGLFSGYLAGVLDALDGRSVCLGKRCRCEVEEKVAAWLHAHPAGLDRPAVSWLVPLLEKDYPCPP